MFRFTLLTLFLGISAVAAESKMIKFPAEVSAIFSSADYSRALESASDKLPKGYELAVTGASFQKIGDRTFAYVHLEKKRVVMFPVVSFPYGSLVGEVTYSPEREVTVKSVSFMPAPEPAESQEITCKSIDVTFRPFYRIKLSPFDPTHENYYLVRFHKTLDLAGTKTKEFSKEGRGRVTKTGFFVDFKNGEKIQGKRLPNGVLKGELLLRGEDVHELICKP